MFKKQWEHDNFIISTDKDKLDLELIYQFLSHTYWADKRTKQQVADSIQNSLCFGMYEQHQQVGFARVVTDYSTFGYLADVFITDQYKGRRLGQWLIETIFNMPELAQIEKWLLLTSDAQNLYKKVGFCQYEYPDRVMIRRKV